jgi:hypothetical protein
MVVCAKSTKIGYIITTQHGWEVTTLFLSLHLRLFQPQIMSSTSDVDQEDLCLASRDGDVALVSQLLANHSFDADDATAALSEAGMDPTIIRLLLQHGADVNVADLWMTPLSKAPGELLRLLAEYGYDFTSDGHRILQSVSIVVYYCS